MSPAALRPATVRAMRRADLPGVMRLIRGLARYEKLEREVKVTAPLLSAHLWGGAWPRVFGLVAASNGRLVGYALWYGTFSSFRGRPVAWLEDLYVEESERGTGLGKRLLAEVARRAKAAGAVRVAWVVLAWNRPALRFYESLGATRGGGWHTYGVAGQALDRLARAAAPRRRRA